MVSTIAWASTRPSSIGKTNLCARNGRFSQRGVSTSILSQAPKLGPPPLLTSGGLKSGQSPTGSTELLNTEPELWPSFD